VAQITDVFDLTALKLAPGEGRRLELASRCAPISLGGEEYTYGDDPLPVRLTVSRMTGGGYALTLEADTTIEGSCMRCLSPAAPRVSVQAREVDVPGQGAELESPYVHDGELDLATWTRDSLALALPAKVLCREDCRGLCPVCAADLNEVEGDHHHEREPDPRWAKLRELRTD